MFKFEKLGLNIWDDVFMNAKHLSEKARLLYCYLLTCPLSNITGVFQITNERIAFDLGFSLDDVKDAMKALRRAHKAFRAGSYVIIVDAPLYLKKRLKTVLRNFSNIIDTLPLKVKIKLHLVHYHWGDLESNIHTKKVREKVRFLGEAYVKNGKDIEAIKLLDYQEHLKEKTEAQELLKEALKTSTKKNTNKKKEDKKEHKEEPLLIDCEALNINYIDANNEALIELNLSNFISIARAVFNRNKPIIDNSSIDNIVQKKSFSNWSTPPLLLPYYRAPKSIDNELGGGAFELHCEEFYDVGNEEPSIKNKEPSKSFKEPIQPPPTMALPDLQEFAENARKYYINNAHRFLDHDTIDAYKKGESERRKLRAIELFREKQYNEHRLEIIEKRLLNKDNPNYNVWKDYPINWDEIKRMMGASFEDVIIDCNCDDGQNSEADSTPLAEPIGEPVKEPLNAFDFDDCRNKVIMKNMSPSKHEELVAYAKAHILNSDPSFDINEWLQKKVEKIAKEEANNATKKNSNAERMSKKDSNDYRLL